MLMLNSNIVTGACIILIFAFATTGVSSDDDSAWWKNSNKLHDDLLIKKNYSARVNPQTAHNHTTNIYFTVALRAVTMDDHSQTLVTHSIFIAVWEDRRLVWDPKEYGNLDETYLSPKEVWRPDITVFNSADPLNMDHFGVADIWLHNKGWIWWYPPMVTKTECPMDLTNYPFDTQTCVVYMGSWTTHGLQVDFYPWNPNATTDELSHAMIKTNHHWEIQHVSLKRSRVVFGGLPFIEVELKITVKRSSPTFTLTVTFPAVAIALLVLVQFVLPVDYPPRVTVGISAALLTIIMLVNLSVTIPPLGDGCPLIVKYYGAILILTVLSIILSGVLARLAKEEPEVLSVPPPAILKTIFTGPLAVLLCIGSSANKVSRSNTGKTDGEDDILGGARKSFQHEWLLVAAAVDRVMALTYCIVIFFCCVSFLQ